MVVMNVLMESAMGYALFKVKEFEDVGSSIPQVEAAIKNGAKFQKAVKLNAFRPFNNAVESLTNMNAISEGLMTDVLEAFLTSNMSSGAKLGVLCPILGQAIKEATGCVVTHTGIVPEIIRGVKLFLPSYINGITNETIIQSGLAMGHAYSRSKVKFNVNRVDNMIIQSIAINDQMDKDLNTFGMRLREWYSYHFPEMSKLVSDHHMYARLVLLIQNKERISDDLLPAIGEILKDDTKAQDVISAARMSMGMEITADDLENINHFAKRVVGMSGYRHGMTGYLNKTVKNVAPNLGTVVGDQVAARLVSHAGSLTNLSKMPASTVQILGAEKALFRALKTKSKTPKYGLLYNASYIGKASATDKGRISRFLANKCAMAARIDNFSETLTSTFGETLKDQVEERLRFYAEGSIPRKNKEVMCEALKAHESKVAEIVGSPTKRKHAGLTNGSVANGDSEEPPKKKKKKNKNKDKEDSNKTVSCIEEARQMAEGDTEAAVTNGDTNGEIKKKKKKKKNRESL